jgi:protein-tyrosine phosphatase
MVFTEHLRRAGLAESVRVSSAGVGPWHVGQSIDARAGAELARRGYPIDVSFLRPGRRSDGTGDLDVPDPYYGGPNGFADVLTMIEAATPGLLAWVRSNLR